MRTILYPLEWREDFISKEGIIGPKALKALGKTGKGIINMSNKEFAKYLRDDSKAAGIFGAAALVSRLAAARRTLLA